MLKPNAFHTPPLRVSRPISACSRCRTAKIKCDGKLPSCSACERLGKADECSSTNDQLVKGKERNYVSSLETRLEKLERQLEEAKGQKSSMALPDTSPGQNAELYSATEKAKGRGRESSHVDDLVSDFGFLSVNATARDFHGFTKEMSFAKLVLSASALEPLPQPTGSALPPRYVLTPLVQYYLDNVLVYYPFLSETTIFAFLAEHDGQAYASPIAHWTVRMVVAISLASRSKKRGDQSYLDAVTYASEALYWIEAVVQPGSIHGIQSLLLLVVYAMLDPHHFNSWYLIGLASRVMVDLGLHQDVSVSTQTSKSDIVLRRRVYHSVYALDRAISMVHRRAFSFTDDSANVNPEIPCDEGAFTHTIMPAQQLLRLRQLQSSTYQQLYWSGTQTNVDELAILSASLTEMHSWAQQLPASMSPAMRALFLSELMYGSILMISAPGVLETSKNYAGATILFFAMRYADNMYDATQNAEEALLYTSHDVLRACYVGERLMDVIEERNPYVFGTVPSERPDILSNCSPLAELRSKRLEDGLKWTTRCIVRLDSILEYLCGQYEYPEPLAEFRLRSFGPLQQLCEHNALAEHGSSSLS